MKRIRILSLEKFDAYTDGFISGTTGTVSAHLHGPEMVNFQPDEYWMVVYRMLGNDSVHNDNHWLLLDGYLYEEITNEEKSASETEQIKSPENQTLVK